jgi:hypothetical protein
MIICGHRAGEVSAVVESHGLDRTYLLTLTAAHEAGDDFAPLRKGVSNAYRAMWRGEPAKRLKAELRLDGSIRALEVTHGRNGWHPHLHVLLLLDEPLTLSELARLEYKLSKRWGEMVARHVGDKFRPSQKRGADLRPAYRADYISKLGLEMSDPGNKTGRRKGHRSPMQILSDLCDFWTEADARIWREYVAGIKGAQQLTWTRGLKAKHRITDRTDAELTEDEVANEGKRLVGTVPPELWHEAQKHPGADVWLLEQTEKAGTLGLTKALRLMRERLTAAR